MKMIKTTILTACLLCAAVAVNAQSTETQKNIKVSAAPAKVAMKDVKIDQEYALPTEKLNKAFKEGQEIPADFPKYDASADRRQNKKKGIAYLVNHQDILSDEAIKYLKENGHI